MMVYNVFVGRTMAIPYLDILKPTQRSPFAILILDPPASFHHYTLKVESEYNDYSTTSGIRHRRFWGSPSQS